MFTDGCITDRGFMQIKIDTQDNAVGDVSMAVLNPRQVVLDPDASSYDPSGWRQWMYIDWASMDTIEATYGKDAAQLVADMAGSDTGTNGPDSVILENHRFGDTNAADTWGITTGVHEGKRIKKVRVVYREHKRYDRRPHFLDVASGDLSMVPATWDKEKYTQFAESAELVVVTRTTEVIYNTVSVDRVAIHHSMSPYKSFSIVPYFPYFRRGTPFGVVRNLISPQEQVNKLESQELHIVNTTANSGWIVEEGALSNMTTDELREQGSQTGVVISHAPDRRPPSKITPNQIPTGIDRISQKAARNIKEISSITDAMLGGGSPEVSGVAMRLQQNRGGIQIAGPMDNLARTRNLVAYKKLELIQQFYTEQRIVRFTDMSNPNEPDQEITINQIDEAGQIVNDVTLGTYDIVVTTAPPRDVFEESQFAAALEMRSAGIAVPDDVVISNSPLQHKEDVAERVRQMMGQGTPTEAEIAQMQQQQQIEAQLQAIEMERAMLEIAKLEADIELVRAKTNKEGATDSRLLEGLEQRIQEKREEFQLRKQLAGLTNRTKTEIANINSDAAVAAAVLKQSGGTPPPTRA